MYTWKKRLLAAILAGCLSVGLMTPALAVEGDIALVDPALTIQVDGENVETIDLPENETVLLTAEPADAEAYQWQVWNTAEEGTLSETATEEEKAALWLDMEEQTQAQCELGYNMVCDLLDENNSVEVRCVATLNAETVMSAPVVVTVTEPTAEPTEEPAETPTTEPTETPAETPTTEPTETPAETPTTEPTETPSTEPTAEPTESPEITEIPEETVPGGPGPIEVLPPMLMSMIQQDLLAGGVETIGKEHFYVTGTNDSTLTDDIQAIDGEIQAPVFNGYTFVGAYVKGVAVERVGQIVYDETTYVYYTIQGSSDVAALVLAEGTQIELRYNLNAVAINYTVTVDGAAAADKIVNGVPYGETEARDIKVIPDSNPITVFPGSEYSFTVEIPRGYTATVTVDGVEQSPKLGVSPNYTLSDDTISTKDAPYTTTATYTATAPSNGNQPQIVVALETDTKHTFSADLITRTKYFTDDKNTQGNRLSYSEVTGDSEKYTGTVQNGTVTWTFKTKKYTATTNISGTTSYEGDRWYLNVLQINGTDLAIPFNNGASETTRLPSGATVTITRQDKSESVGWRKTSNWIEYTVVVNNCYENLVVTGGNLNSMGWKEYMPYAFTGVADFQYYHTQDYKWETAKISQPFAQETVDISQGFRFQLLPGYGNPVLTVNNYNFTIEGPDTDGYYTAKAPRNYQFSSPGKITITSEMIRVNVQYTSGEVENAQVPTDNGTYSLADDHDILIPLYIPTDPFNAKVFVGWENGVNTYLPNQNVELKDLSIIGGIATFTAQWQDVANAGRITFKVQIVNEEGTILSTIFSQAPNGVPIILDVNSSTIKNWFDSNPEYELAKDNQLYYDSIANNQVVELKVVEKEVTITYQVVGEGGRVDLGSEEVKVKTGTAQGSVPSPNPGYEFVGWYTDAACEYPVDPSWIDDDNRLIPQKTGDMWMAATYYVKFRPAEFNLTIVKNVDKLLTGQDFLFWIIDSTGAKIPVLMDASKFTGTQGKITITLPSGSYTVEEDTAYSWRYEVVGQDSFADVSSEQTVTFTNKLKENDPGDKWLTGHDEINNIFNVTVPVSGASTLNSMDAILPKSTAPKDDGSDEDQPDNDQPDDSPEMTNAEGGAEHV